MDKVNKHPFSGQEILFATLHEKEKILFPLFVELGISLKAALINTDSLGTFSGELERKGTIRETLRGKIKLASELHPDHRFFLVSEGSFGPHPFIGFVSSDLESLLLFDKHENVEIYVETISTQVINDEIEISPKEDLNQFLKRIDFPNHGVIVRPSELFNPIYKGIQNFSELNKAIEDCALKSEFGKVKILTDLRSLYNPTRQKVIFEAGLKLIEALKNFCPECEYPGLRIVDGVPGLPCRICGESSQISKSVIYECSKCYYSTQKPRPDGVVFLEPENCEFCNP